MLYAIWFFTLVLLYLVTLVGGMTLGAFFLNEILGLLVGTGFAVTIITFIAQGLQGKYLLSYRIVMSFNQNFQVIASPLLNIKCKHKFGQNVDMATSHIIGLNLRDTGESRWKYIEKVLSILLEKGDPHSIKSIDPEEI